MQDILAYNARISALEGLLEQAQDKLAGFPQAVRDAATPE
jgi:C4-type Zn-finger protein